MPNRVDLIYNYYYPLSDFDNVTMAWYTINGDVCFVCPSLIFMETINTISNNNYDNNTRNGFVYYFPSPSSPYLAEHAAELPFVSSANLSYSMISAWTNTAKFGKPNITNEWTDIY